MRDGIEVTLIPDVAVAHLLFEERIDCAIVGADRIARNGDTANKVGTRGLACILHYHEKPLYVAAPFTSIDMAISSGKEIQIEERNEAEVTTMAGVRIAPPGVKVRNPAFDVTPAAWIAGIITDRGFTGRNIAQELVAQSIASPSHDQNFSGIKDSRSMASDGPRPL